MRENIRSIFVIHGFSVVRHESLTWFYYYEAHNLNGRVPETHRLSPARSCLYPVP